MDTDEQTDRGMRVCHNKTHIISTSFNLLVKSVLVLVPEWRITHQEDVEDHTYTHTNTL